MTEETDKIICACVKCCFPGSKVFTQIQVKKLLQKQEKQHQHREVCLIQKALQEQAKHKFTKIDKILSNSKLNSLDTYLEIEKEITKWVAKNE